MTQERIYREEQQYFQKVIQEIRRQIDNLGPRYYGDDYTEQVLDAQQQERQERLELLASEPYFGRLDFQEKNQDKPQSFYIGKRGLEKQGANELYVIDWRAPVASLFYSFTGGAEQVGYEAPEGQIEGTVFLKRNIVVRDRELQRVVDSYVHGEENLGISDEYLLYRLGENKDHRLRDIVSTIQAEQDRIIRSSKDRIVIVQGAAGSGKTTVALHRLAFLLYQYQSQLDPRKLIIFAPNTMFLDYISDVLPELGVGNIQQTTFSNWAQRKLGDSIKLENEDEDGARRFGLKQTKLRQEDEQSVRFKGSAKFLNWLQQALHQYEQALLPQTDFMAWEGSVLQVEQIKIWFEQEYKHYELAPRRERLVGRMLRWLEMELKELPDAIRRQRSRSAKQRLRTYIKKIAVPEPYPIYKALFEMPKKPTWLANVERLPQAVIRSTKRKLKEGIVGYEDLAPLVWIHDSLYGKTDHFHHIVLDEAQDVSPFQMALLGEQMRNPSMTILGDLAQGIHESRGITRWEQLGDMLSQDHISYYALQQSYRSTTEIITFANDILVQAHLQLQPAVPVFRSGQPVTIRRADQREEQLDQMTAFVHEAAADGMKSIALIGRTRERCAETADALEQMGLSIQRLVGNETRYRGGLSIMPVDLAKGLEFDAVLLFDADCVHYDQTSLSAKLMYVGCTRALHRLDLIYYGEPSPLLAGMIEQPSDNMIVPN